MTPAGNFEGHNILNRLDRRSRAATTTKRGSRRCAQNFSTSATARVRPGLDDKVLADWNGLMIAALANAGLLFAEPSWLDTAARAFAFIARAMTRGDRLGHSWREGQLKFPGLASDFAAMIRAALALYEATGQASYLEQALTWQRALDRDYANAETGTYYLTAADAEGLVIRPAATADEATPNHNAVAAQNLIRLALLAGDQSWREKADRLIAAIAPLVDREPLHAHGAAQCRRPAPARRGNRGDRRRRKRRGAARRRARSCRLSTASCCTPVRRKACRGLIRRRRSSRRQAAAQAFVCIGETCSLPVTDPAGLIAAVESARRN